MSTYRFTLTIETAQRKGFYTASMNYDRYDSQAPDSEALRAITVNTVGRTAGQAILRAAGQVADQLDNELEWEAILIAQEGKA